MTVIATIKRAAVAAYNPNKQDDANDALNRIIGLCEGAELVHSVNPVVTDTRPERSSLRAYDPLAVGHKPLS